MECANKNIADLVPDFFLGQLNETEATLVKEHLSICPHCRELLNHVQWFSKGLKEFSVQELKQHISSETLVKFADNPDVLDQKTREYTETHLLFCDQCQSELQVLQDLNVEIAGKTAEASASMTRFPSLLTRLSNQLVNLVRKPAFAYAVAVTILLITIIPKLRPVVRPTVQGIQTEAVSILSEQTRGTANYIPVYRQRSNPTVRVVISSYWPDFEKFVYTISVEDESGKEYLQFKDFEGFGEKGFTQFILNASRMPDGRYRLKIVATSKSDLTDIKTSYYPFELVTK